MNEQEKRNSGQREYPTGVLLKRFIPYYRPYVGTLIRDLGCAALTTVCELVLPMIMRQITDTGMNHLELLTVRMILGLAFLYFMLKVVVNYPQKEEEKLILRQNIAAAQSVGKPILKLQDILEAREVVREVYMDEKIERYIVDIVFATRYPEEYGLKDLKNMISFGGSPRASISLALAARAYAFIKRRGYVIPEDVRAVAYDVLRHRIGLSYEAEANNMTSEEIINEVLNAVEVP